MYDLLLFLHVAAAFALVAGSVCLVPYAWGRGEGPVVERLTRTGAILAAGGGMTTFLLGLALVWEVGYGIFELWIVLAILLWLIGTVTGERIPRVARERSRVLHGASAVAVTVILVLMIWKPGA